MSDEPVNILLVDDRPENLTSMEALLARPDRHLLKATSGNDALRLLLKHDVALVLLDVQMPVMDGYEIARLMRGRERTRSVPIIFVTASDRSEERAYQGYEVGAVDFLYKPISPIILKSKVDVFIQLHRNAAELKALNGALELTSAELRRRVADLQSVNHTLSHDLRAPLRSIDGFSRILSEEYSGKLGEEADRYLLRIANACARMSRMLDDLYRLLRIGSADQSFSRVDCQVVLDGVLEDLRADIQATGAVVDAGPMPTIPANPTLLALILQNLIANAIKFRGAESPRIHVSAERDSAGWRFSIKDNGIGIEDKFAGKIFGLFPRLTNDTVPGTGVGLALCKQSVEKHGGAIWVESEAGRGCTFHFTIPAVQPDSQTRSSESS